MAATESPIGNGAKTMENITTSNNHNTSNSLKLDINTGSPAVPSHSVPITPDADYSASQANVAQDTLTLTTDPTSSEDSELLVNESSMVPWSMFYTMCI